MEPVGYTVPISKLTKAKSGLVPEFQHKSRSWEHLLDCKKGIGHFNCPVQKTYSLKIVATVYPISMLTVEITSE